jgi:hypothetical protein
MGGCFGQFTLTKKVYAWNEGVAKDPVVQSVVFWALVIIPIYEIGFMADVFILNVLEALGSKSPLASVSAGEDGNVVVVVDGKRVDVLTDDGGGGFTLSVDGERRLLAQPDDRGGVVVDDLFSGRRFRVPAGRISLAVGSVRPLM